MILQNRLAESFFVYETMILCNFTKNWMSFDRLFNCFLKAPKLNLAFHKCAKFSNPRISQILGMIIGVPNFNFTKIDLIWYIILKFTFFAASWGRSLHKVGTLIWRATQEMRQNPGFILIIINFCQIPWLQDVWLVYKKIYFKMITGEIHILL